MLLDHDLALIRQCAKDEAAYTQLVALFQQNGNHSPPVPEPPPVTIFDNPFLQAAPAAIVICDAREPDFPTVYVNAAFERDTGYSLDDVRGKNLRLLQGDDRDQPARAEIREALERDEACRVVLRNYCKDGSMFWNELHMSPIRDANGTVTHVIGVQINITERKQMEEDLHRSAETFRALVENSPDFITRLERDSTHVYANPALAFMMGLSTNEIVGKDNAALGVPAEVSAHYDKLREHIFETGEEQATDVSYPVGDQQRHYHLRLVPEFDANGEVTTILSVARDITERKQLEDQLARSERMYRHIAENTSDGIFIWDAVEGRITYASPAYDRMWGRAEGESVNRDTGDLYTSVHPDDRGAFQITQAAIARREESAIYAYRARHADGHYFWKEDHARFVYAPDGTHLMAYVVCRDITLQKRLEDQLRQTAESFRALVDNSTDYIIRLDRDGTLLYANPMYLRERGVTLDEVIGKPEYDTQTEYAQMFTAALHRAYDEKAVVHLQYDYTLRDGSAVYLDAQLVPEFDDSGEVVSLISTVRDVTRYKRMGDALRASEERLRSVIDNIPVMIGLINPEGVLEFTNKQWVDTMGWTAAELARFEHPLQAFYPDPEKFAALMEYITSRNVDWNEFQTTTRYNGVITTVWANVFLSDGSLIGIGQDISERKRMEEQLRRREQRFRTLAENSPDAIQRFDLQGRHLHANPAYTQSFGPSVAQVTGKTIAETGVMPEHAQTFEELQAAVQASQHPLDVDFSYTDRQTGQERHFHTRMIPEFAGDGEVVSLLAVTRDVTERMQAQQRALDLALELERRQLLAAFIQNTAHEFRTPLATIGTSTHLIARLDDRERRAQKANQITTQVKHITRLIDMMLLMTRLEGNGDLLQAPFSPSTLLRTVCEETAASCQKGHTMHAEIPADLPIIYGDADLLADAFAQIIDNACRYTPPGGAITVRAGQSDGHIWVEVHDTGPGIPAESLPHIFDTFWREDAARSTPGFGLGLTIARKIIERHDGQISVSSKHGEGTTIRVLLPVKVQKL